MHPLWQLQHLYLTLQCFRSDSYRTCTLHYNTSAPTGTAFVPYITMIPLQQLQRLCLTLQCFRCDSYSSCTLHYNASAATVTALVPYITMLPLQQLQLLYLTLCLSAHGETSRIARHRLNTVCAAASRRSFIPNIGICSAPVAIRLTS
jgi:hypothetical protein